MYTRAGNKLKENVTFLESQFEERVGNGYYSLPPKIEDNCYAKFWGVYKVHYSLCENG